MTESDNKIRILYNGRCVICNREITTYARYAASKDLPLWFEDLHETDLTGWGLSRTEAARILHVKFHGKVLTGMEAYRALWSEMPRYRLLAHITGLPGIRQVSTILYDNILSTCIFRCGRMEAKPKPRTGATIRS